MKIKEEIDGLASLLLKMSDTVCQNISEALLLYTSKDKKDDSQINDDIVDKYERQIEQMCLNLLLKERLYGSDLKRVTGILKLVEDLERIGDHAEDIVTFSKKLKAYNEEYNKRINNLANYVLDMFKNSMLSYVNNDINLANETIIRDDYVDKEYYLILEDLTKKENITKNYLEYSIYTTLVVKYLERIADHSVNICEWVVYMISGYHKDKKIY